MSAGHVNEGPAITLQAGGAIAPHTRVVMSGGKLAAAGAADREVGTLKDRALADLDLVGVYAANAGGVYPMVAAGAISQHARIYPAAAGRVSATINGRCLGIALEAAAGAASVFPALRIPGIDGTKDVEAHTADDTLTEAESGSVHTTTGASGTVVFTLPAAVVGLEYYFQVGAAQELRLDPDGTETVALPSTGVQGAAGKYLTANADGETVHIVCTTAGGWSVFGYTGTWTAEG